eukprot:scaffold10564_cov149-Skeletonema_marinoi.AAC.1
MGGKFFCPVPACQDATDSYGTPWGLRRHFRDRHPRDFVDVEGQNLPIPKCQLCNMQADPRRAASHENSRFCREGRERIVQTNAAIANQRALEVGFTAYGEDLERVEVFKYLDLGRLMSMDDTDTQAIRDNLSKARKVWKMIHRLLRGDNMNPRPCYSLVGDLMRSNLGWLQATLNQHIVSNTANVAMNSIQWPIIDGYGSIEGMLQPRR